MESPIRFLKLHLYSSALISLLALHEASASSAYSSRHDDQRYSSQNSIAQKEDQIRIQDEILMQAGSKIVQKRQECTSRNDCLRLFQGIIGNAIPRNSILESANNEAFSTEAFLFSKLSETAKTNFQNGYRVNSQVLNMRSTPKHLTRDDVIILLIQEIGKVSAANQSRQASLDRDIRLIESLAQKLPDEQEYTPLLGTFGPEIRQTAEDKTPIHSTFRAIRDNMSITGWDTFQAAFNESVKGQYDSKKLLQSPKEKWRSFMNNGKPLVFVNPLIDAPKDEKQAGETKQVDAIKEQGTALASQLFGGFGSAPSTGSDSKKAKKESTDQASNPTDQIKSALGGLDFGSLLGGLNKK